MHQAQPAVKQRSPCSISTQLNSKPGSSIALIFTTVRVFADTNIVIYAESAHDEKSEPARTIVESAPVLSTQVFNEVIVALITN